MGNMELDMTTQNNESESRERQLEGSLRETRCQLAAAHEQIAELTRIIVELNRRIDELTHKKNSSNSSTPPSCERLGKPAPKSLRKRSGKSVGGQKGRQGHGLKLDREPDEFIQHRPIQCEKCSRLDQCNLQCVGTRYEYEIEINTKLKAHRLMGCGACPLTGQALRGNFPNHITGVKQYGSGIFGLVVTLSTLGIVSADRIKKLFESQGISISVGTIQNMLGKAARLTESAVERIRQTITGLPVVHHDETGLRAAGKLHWLHCACNDQWRYYSAQAKRGREGIDATNVLPQSNGVAVHDFWKSYETYDNVKHAMCCAHLERELDYASETGSQHWAKPLQTLLQTLCHRRKVIQSEGGTAFPEGELTEYLRQYDVLVEEGVKANPLPESTPRKRGRPARGKFRCLAERFRDFKDDILRFTQDWSVPFTNNTAEQAVRGARVKEKVSGCFRTKRGADDFAIVNSFVSTAHAQGLSIFHALRRAFEGDAIGVLFPPATE